ncbi:hypothetical protein BRADI_1g32265v3 [Brachypodium distachyon]|uniref:BTB domain-containing protein n=1 Tax=Brachypodium distachyon TaxID=15368 RepID=A0A0Q3JYG8_BRADI|nr:hypothetical protein BRADI_1g32265v3 [Brachypodium distachyon]
MTNNSSTNLTRAARLVRVLKIEGYSASTTVYKATKTRGMSSDGCIKSRWSVDGYGWEINLYPATFVFSPVPVDQETLFQKPGSRRPGSVRELMYPTYTSKWLALQLVFLGELTTSNANVRASLAYRLVDPAGVLQPSGEKSVSHIYGRHLRGGSSDAVVLVETRDLAESGYLRDDCLAVECAVTVKEVIPLPSTNLHQHFGELLEKETGADITFLVSGESFSAHKLILGARSPVFMAEFFGNMKEKNSRRVEIEDMEAPVFKALLHYIYTDRVPELYQNLDATMGQQLLAAADRYGLDRLKLLCEIKLSGGITVDTAGATLALAEQHNCALLKAKCMEFIVSTPAILDAVLATEGYKHLEASCPLVLPDLLKSARGRNN